MVLVKLVALLSLVSCTVVTAFAIPPAPLHVRGGGGPVVAQDIRNGRTSDGKRRLLSMKDPLSGSKGGGAKGALTSKGALTFSRDGALKLVGVASVGYIAKQFFNGGRYDGAPDLTGKLALVTGGNSGIGKETATRLAQLGADVIIACRNPEKAEKAVQEIVAQARNGLSRSASSRVGSVSYLTVDLSDLKTVERFAEQLKAKTNKVDILVNNAGVMAVPDRRLTSDGFETHLGINHLGHFYLTNKIFDLIKRSPKARIINVSSEAHRIPGFDLLDLNYDKRSYEKWSAYGQSKLANVLFTIELDRRLKEKGLDNKVLTVSCHPGVVRTELGRYLIEGVPAPVLLPLAAVGYFFTKSPKQGAQTQIYLAAEPGVPEIGGGPGGYYFSDCKPKAASKEATDLASAAKLWELSEKLTGAQFTV